MCGKVDSNRDLAGLSRMVWPQLSQVWASDVVGCSAYRSLVSSLDVNEKPSKNTGSNPVGSFHGLLVFVFVRTPGFLLQSTTEEALRVELLKLKRQSGHARDLRPGEQTQIEPSAGQMLGV